MKKKENANTKNIIDTLQLPKDVLLGAAIISMTGNTDFLIENFKNIIKYQTDLVLIQCKKNRIQVLGKNLQIELYSKEEIKLHGIITEIKFL